MANMWHVYHFCYLITLYWLLPVSSTVKDIDRIPKNPENVCDEEGKCISKCCAEGEAYNTNNYECEDFDGAFNITVWMDGDERIARIPENLTVIHNFNCSDNGSVIQLQAPAGRIGLDLNKGKVMLKKVQQLYMWEELSLRIYCVDNMLPGLIPGNGLICKPIKPPDLYPVLRNFTVYGMLLSSFFLGLSALVYMCVPSLRNIAGFTLLPYLVTLMGAFISIASLQLINPLAPFHKTLCFSMTLLAYFCILSAFFWLNVKSFDLSRKFGGPLINTNSLGRPTAKFPCIKFCAYCAWGFGVPAAATIVMASVECLEHILPEYVVTPKIRQTCFPTGNEKLVWIDIPIAVLCLTNTVFFAMTWRAIDRNRLHPDKQRLMSYRLNQRKLFVELFLLTGTHWLLEVGSMLIPHPVWVITDLFNSLIGIPIFFILMSKKRVTQFLRYNLSASRSSSARTMLR